MNKEEEESEELIKVFIGKDSTSVSRCRYCSKPLGWIQNEKTKKFFPTDAMYDKEAHDFFIHHRADGNYSGLRHKCDIKPLFARD